MAGLDSFEKLPIWQRVLLFFVVAGTLGVGWFYLFYEEAVEQRASANIALQKAKGELDRVQKEKEAFLERQRKHQEAEEALKAKLRVLPTSASAIDNMMQTFQRQARLVGLNVESWDPGEEEKLDYYARLPVSVSAIGTWPQTGEFLRRVSELDRIVSIDKLSMEVKNSKSAEPGEHPQLKLAFEAATYRFLTEAERSASPGGGKKKRSRRKKTKPAKKKKK